MTIRQIFELKLFFKYEVRPLPKRTLIWNRTDPLSRRSAVINRERSGISPKSMEIEQQTNYAA